MSIVTIYKIENVAGVGNLVERLDRKKVNGCWMSAQPSKYADNEVFVQYWYNESIEYGIKRAFSEQEASEIYSFLKENGKTVVLKRIYCFINLLTKTLEIYRGKDGKTEEIAAVLEKLLETKIVPISLKPEELQKLYETHATELSQAMFKNIEGLTYDILRGKYLENNQKFKDYRGRFLDSLRVVSFRPKIRFLNGNNRYQVTVNGDKGTMRLSDQNNGFTFRPRFEIRQLTFIIASILGLINS